MVKIDLGTAETGAGSDDPALLHEPVSDRARRRLARAAGLTQFGVNLLTLGPGV
jgi:uncharacterized cupin superfamily protein